MGIVQKAIYRPNWDPTQRRGTEHNLKCKEFRPNPAFGGIEPKFKIWHVKEAHGLEVDNSQKQDPLNPKSWKLEINSQNLKIVSAE